jgi:DNA-directed RNA polymerase subunit RPC12/RpoP
VTRLSAPAFCKKCHSLVISNYLSKRPRCPRCRGKVIFYNDKTLQEGDSQEDVFSWTISDEGNVFRLPKILYLCPICGQMKLEFFDIGCWD